MASLAQNNTEDNQHMTFKGVPIDGTLNEYVSKMKQDEFTLIEMEDGIATLRGDFAVYKDCRIRVATLKGKDLVSQITVDFPPQQSWTSLSSDYFNLKELFTEKYGDPTESVEKFDSPIEGSDGKRKLLELAMDGCKYYTIYETEKGSIKLTLKNNGIME